MELRKILLFVATLLLLIGCKSTGYIKYHRHINEAYFYYYQGEYKTAQQYFEKAIKKVNTPFERDLLYYSVCLWKNQQINDATKILDTNFFFGTVGGARNLFPDMPDTLMSELTQKSKAFTEAKWETFKNSQLYALFESLRTNDQIARKAVIENKKIIEGDSSSYKNAVANMERVDSNNLSVLDSIFKIHGYLGGTNWIHHRQLHLLMVHSGEKWVKENQHFLLDELRRGHILPIDYAIMIDRFLYQDKGLNEYYGQYLGGIGDVSPEEYFKRTNSIGLSPYFIYTDYLAKNGQPKLTPFYEYYKQRKDDFNCIK